jgi:hypothetical protein
MRWRWWCSTTWPAQLHCVDGEEDEHFNKMKQELAEHLVGMRKREEGSVLISFHFISSVCFSCCGGRGCELVVHLEVFARHFEQFEGAAAEGEEDVG